ncbi:hypothetical protein B0H34DRAFT_784504 [Crassisporium funariophilum]|nr:hypothetical protein B0H34DRAFT_784504 [Crassisporium funariophilum]
MSTRHLLTSLTPHLDRKTSEVRQWPFTAARSSGSEGGSLLTAILAVRAQGKVDESGKTTWGVMFWLYPTGLNGPYHESREGEIDQHGTLITVERGVLLTEAVQQAKGGFNERGIGHSHVAAA